MTGKTIVVLAMSVILLGGCSKGESMDLPDGKIRLGAGAPVSRAAINTMAELSDVGDRIGIYGVRTDGTADGVSQWDVTRVMDNVRTTSVNTADGAISWDGNYYYPVEDNGFVRFCAYYPYASANEPDQSFGIVPPTDGAAPRLRVTITGVEDILYATPVTGSKTVSPAALNFRHALTQIRFQIVDKYGTYAGQTIESITVNGANTVATMDVETGTFDTWTTPSDDLTAGVASAPITGSENTPQAVGRGIMLEPGLAQFSIKVKTSLNTFEQVTVKPSAEASFAPGRSYLITLVFKKLGEVGLSAELTPWEPVDGGNVEIEGGNAIIRQ